MSARFLFIIELHAALEVCNCDIHSDFRLLWTLQTVQTSKHYGARVITMIIKELIQYSVHGHAPGSSGVPYKLHRKLSCSGINIVVSTVGWTEGFPVPAQFRAVRYYWTQLAVAGQQVSPPERSVWLNLLVHKSPISLFDCIFLAASEATFNFRYETCHRRQRAGAMNGFPENAQRMLYSVSILRNIPNQLAYSITFELPYLSPDSHTAASQAPWNPIPV